MKVESLLQVMKNSVCIILNEKLKYLDEWNSYRSYAAEKYNKLLKDAPVITPTEPKWAVVSSFHLYVIRTEKRQELQEFLSTKGIQTGIHYPVPIGEAEYYKASNLVTKAHINTPAWKDQLLSLPMHPFLEDEEIHYVCRNIKEFFDDSE